MLFGAADVHRGFEGDEFYPVFQPLVELRTGQLAGFEALARWTHGKLGPITPDEFIPIVEHAGFIDKLTRVILEKAFASSALVDSALTMAVNISPIQLLGFQLPERLAALAERGGFSLDRLTIEITESALVVDLSRAKAVADELKALHCRLALDDFGSGYSSLRHLHALSFDELKVDRSFVSTMIQQRESRKIVASVVGLSQSLGLLTAAEGVETREQEEMLFRMGCDLGQGWLFGKPVRAEELPGLISAASKKAPARLVTPLDESSFVSPEPLPSQRLAQLQAIYDGAPVGLCFLDRNLRYVSLNRRLAQLNGVPFAAHLGRTVAEVIPRVFPRVERFIRRALEGHAISGVEIHKPALESGGRDQTHVISYQPVRDEAGEVLGVSVAVMDATDRRGIEAALRESEDHHRIMVKLSPHVPWVLNSEGEVTEASPRWEDITGQPLELAFGTGWLDALHPDDVPPTQQAIRDTLRTGQPIDIEYRVHNTDGEWLWMRSRGAPRFGVSGEIVCVYGVVEEIQSQKQTTEELLTWQATSRAALDAVPIGIIVADARKGDVLVVNPAAKQIFGDALFPGQKLAEYAQWRIARADCHFLETEEYPLARAILHGESVDAQHLFLMRPDGRQLQLTISAKPLHNEDGRRTGAVMLVRTPDSNLPL